MQAQSVEGTRAPVNDADQMIFVKGQREFNTHAATTDDNNVHRFSL
jgi:hypothetical protein